MTIVVLLILAGVSISLILDNNGIIQKSKDARREYGQAKANEQEQMDDVEDWIDETVINGLKGTNETNPYLPNEDYKRVPGTNLDKGLVIGDKKGNEYVWVEVPKTATVYATAGLKITGFSDTELALIKDDLINYAKYYRDSRYSDKWSIVCGIKESDIYVEKYNKMLKSIYQNGGFWIGRYEVGIDENTVRTKSNRNTTTDYTPVIKADKIPYNWISVTQAETLAETFAPEGYTSSLMFGLQWDLVCKYLENKGMNPGTTADSLQKAIKSNSKDWGNYVAASFKMTNTKAMYSTNNGESWNKILDEEKREYEKIKGNKTLLTTGADKRNSMLNIYDLAGNLNEYTLELHTAGQEIDVARGGCYYTVLTPAAGRVTNTDSYNYGYRLGARVVLY